MQISFRQSIVVLACISGAYSLILLDTTALNVSLPAIQREFQLSQRILQWIVDAYILIFSSIMVLCGLLTDIMGRLRALKIGLIIFAFGSLLCGAAVSGGFLIGGRVVQGLGAALLAPASLSLLHTIYDSENARSKALVIFTTSSGVTQAVGPVIGGIITDLFGWRYIFLINLPIVVIIISGVQFFPKLSLQGIDKKIPILGNIVLLALLCSITSLIIDFQLFTSVQVIVISLLIFFLILVLFYIQNNGLGPLNSLLIRSKEFMSYAGAGFLMYSSYYGTAFIITLELQNSNNQSAFQTGMIFLIAALPMVVLPYLLKTMVKYIGDPRSMLLGLIIGIAGFSSLVINHSKLNFISLSISMFFIGAAFGIAVTPQIRLVMQSSPHEALGQASAMFNTFRQIGTAFGVAIMGLLYPILKLPGTGIFSAVLLTVAVAFVYIAQRSKVEDDSSSVLLK